MPAITGAHQSISLLCTTAATTASQFIYKMGYSHGTITNPSAAARTYTYYGCDIITTTASQTVYGPYPLYDQDGVALSQTVGTSSMWELPSAVAGVAILVPITTTGASTSASYVHFER